mmetsp:Transcript_5608/g.11590  ORF Transcript_5608/g.11590 Transcript_5608/m.11590 type:complete len:92 (+) Transcript_5608:1202-1477(+)
MEAAITTRMITISTDKHSFEKVETRTFTHHAHEIDKIRSKLEREVPIRYDISFEKSTQTTIVRLRKKDKANEIYVQEFFFVPVDETMVDSL